MAAKKKGKSSHSIIDGALIGGARICCGSVAKTVATRAQLAVGD